MSSDVPQRSPNQGVPRYLSAWIVLLVLSTIAIRIAATTGDLAIDEVWSLSSVRDKIHRSSDIFTLRHDNNHLLNTMLMFWLGPDEAGIYYRLPAALAAVLSVWIAGRIAMRQGGFPACLVAWILVGGSYLMILYGTEARGYSYVVCLAYLSWLFLLRVDSSGRWYDALAFAISASLGFFAHLTFLYCYSGFCIWSLRKFQKKTSMILISAHVLPCLTAVWMYFNFIRGMEIGGGPDANVVFALISTLSIIAGGPLTGLFAWIAAIFVFVVLVAAYFRVLRFDPAKAACYLTIIVLAPAVVLLKTRHSEIYPRYFLVPVAFSLLMTSEYVASWWKSGMKGKIGPMALLGAYLLGNLWWSVRLLDHGRGDYSGAVVWMANRAHAMMETVSSDHPFRNSIMFAYFAKRDLPRDNRLRYVEHEDVTTEGTDWYICHNFEEDPPYPEIVSDFAGNKYHFEKVFRHRSLTGWNWWIYRRNSALK